MHWLPTQHKDLKFSQKEEEEYLYFTFAFKPSFSGHIENSLTNEVLYYMVNKQNIFRTSYHIHATDVLFQMRPAAILVQRFIVVRRTENVIPVLPESLENQEKHNKHGCAKAETRRCSVRPSLKRIRHLPAQPMKCQKMFINYQDLAVNQLREEALPRSQAVGPIY